MAEMLRAAAEAEGVGIDRSLWHALLLMTAGEVARERLEGEKGEAYESVALRVLRRAWAPLVDPIVKHWLPVVQEGADRHRAARELVRAIATPRSSPQ